MLKSDWVFFCSSQFYLPLCVCACVSFTVQVCGIVELVRGIQATSDLRSGNGGSISGDVMKYWPISHNFPLSSLFLVNLRKRGKKERRRRKEKKIETEIEKKNKASKDTVLYTRSIKIGRGGTGKSSTTNWYGMCNAIC